MSYRLTENDRVIFLDIDGVLNNAFSMGHRRGRIDPICMNVFNHLVRKISAHIVVSSTWRLGQTVKLIEEILQGKGLEHKIHSFTPNRRGCRGEEIEEWLNIHTPPYLNFNEYLILDDDSDMLYHQRENFIHCPNDTGLTPNIAYRAWRTIMSKRNWWEDEDDRFEGDFGISEYIKARKN